MLSAPILPSDYSAFLIDAPEVTHWPASFDDIAYTSDATRDWWDRLATLSPTIVRQVYAVRVLPEELWPWFCEYGGTDAPRHVYRNRAHVWTCETFAEALVEALWPDLEPGSEEVADRVKALHYVVEHQDRGLLTHLERSLPVAW